MLEYFMGLNVGDLVKVRSGPRHYVGHDGLVIGLELVEDPSEDLIKEPEPNVRVLCREETVVLYAGWVSKI